MGLAYILAKLAFYYDNRGYEDLGRLTSHSVLFANFGSVIIKGRLELKTHLGASIFYFLLSLNWCIMSIWVVQSSTTALWEVILIAKPGSISPKRPPYYGN